MCFCLNTHMEGPQADHTLPWSGRTENSRRQTMNNCLAGVGGRTEAGTCEEMQDKTWSYIFGSSVAPRDPCVKGLATKVPESGRAMAQRKVLKGDHGTPGGSSYFLVEYEMLAFHNKLPHGKGQINASLITVIKYMMKAS